MTLVTAAILSLTFLVVGFLIGNLFPVFASRGDEEAENEAGERASLGEEGEAESVQATAQRTAILWREEGTKELKAEIEGEELAYGSELNSEQQGRLALMLVDLQNWVGLETQIKNAEGREKAKKVAPPRREGEEAQKPPEEQAPRQGFNPGRMLRKAMESDVKMPVDEQPASIAAQIDEILQEQVRGTALEEKGIQLREAEGKGMVVRVGMENFEGVDEVPDPEIQTAIREAAEEWERRIGDA